ncbi:MAG: ATP synthase F1 subunit gamma [Alphaproteobacteria bacterium]
MSQLKTLKKRIQTIESTRKITAAMKLVSSSYFKKAEKKLHAAVPYTAGLSRVLDDLLTLKKNTDSPLIQGGKGNVHLLIITSGNRGLCGGFNMNLGRCANMEVGRLINEGKTVKIICIGSKAFSILDPLYRSYVIKNLHPKDKEAWMMVSNLVEEINLWAHGSEIDSCSIIYASFRSLLFSENLIHSLIPYSGDITVRNKNFQTPSSLSNGFLFAIEPTFRSVLRKAAISNLKSQVYFSILETQTSEQSARMIAMDGATKNSDEMLRKLKLFYNRNRQATITRELVEIIAGAESV